MSKAFTKDDAAPDALIEADPADLVPAGAVNYLTAEGLRKFRDELEDLARVSPKTEDLERRRRYLARLVEISRPIDPASQTGAVIRFGATVRLVGEDGVEKVYAVVGIHEADAASGRLSWTSPLARALLGRTTGDTVVFQTPGGESELEILGVEFRPLT